MVAHNHLDLQRRDRGACPGCDADWANQDLRLAAASPITATIQQLDRMAERPKPKQNGPWCRAAKLLPPPENIHTCALRPDHPGNHRCPLCESEWK